MSSCPAGRFKFGDASSSPSRSLFSPTIDDSDIDFFGGINSVLKVVCRSGGIIDCDGLPAFVYAVKRANAVKGRYVGAPALQRVRIGVRADDRDALYFMAVQGRMSPAFLSRMMPCCAALRAETDEQACRLIGLCRAWALSFRCEPSRPAGVGRVHLSQPASVFWRLCL